MNAIDTMIRAITAEIPQQLLIKGLFTQNSSYTINSVDSLIKDKIIREHYIPDMDISYGTNTFLSMQDAQVTYDDGRSQAYHYSQEKLGGLDIVSCHGVYTNLEKGFITHNQRQYNASLLPNTDVSIVAANTVLVSGGNFFASRISNTALYVVLSNDAELRNINPRWYETLAIGAVLVAKRFLYNELAIRANMSSLYKGGELGMFNEILSNYADAAEQYTEFKHLRLTKSLLMNDRTAYTKHIRGQLSPGLTSKYNKR